MDSSDAHQVVLCDSTRAAELIVLDDAEAFFAQINPLDIAIQMKTTPDKLKVNPLGFYKAYLQSQVSTFSGEEANMIKQVWNRVLEDVMSVNTSLIMPVNMVKIKTDHYGPNVFYTRGNTIFIPENMLDSFQEEIIYPVMLHEYWHVLSEERPQLKEKLYEIFGFTKHGLKLTFPKEFKSQLLTNPDGADLHYAISLSDGSWLMPVIYSRYLRFEPVRVNFMGHLSMEIVKFGSDGIVVNPLKEKDAVRAAEMQQFFNSIGDNTQYIIHPDEIVADNFMLAVMAERSGKYDRFSDDGKKRIKKLMTALKTEP